MFGFYGKLLRVNLSEEESLVEDISTEVLKTYLGGKGLGSYLLLKNVGANIEPLSPGNKLIFTTGNAAGTHMWGSSRYGVFTRSPLTGLYAESYSGGKVAPAIKGTGYDAIILEGQAKRHVYLEISDTGVRFHNASHLWGKDTYSTEDSVLKETGVKGAQAVVIGPAGENKVRYACIENNYWRSAGRTGVGAVLGSKNVKALVFHGVAKAQLANPQMLKEYVNELKDLAKDHPAVKAYKTYGTTMMVSMMNEAKCFPTKYWSKNQFAGWKNICGETFVETQDVRPKACPQCMMACGKLTTVKSGRHAGLKLEGPEYETIYSFGGLCCIDRLDEIIYLNDLCDRLGLDTITAGNLVALIMEASERGLIEYNLKYGDAVGAASLLKKIVSREGIGEILAEGIKIASKELGLSDLAIHVKGLEPPGYDPRVLKGVGLGYATSARGACHLRATFYKPELSGMIDPQIIEDKAKLYIDYENRLTIFNTQILCVFYRDLIQWPNLATLVEATTGLKYTEQEFNRMANNIIGLTRQFNINHGAGPQDDKLPKRLFDEPHKNVESNLTESELNQMVLDYYKLRGWSERGIPSVLEI
ncbi:MAG: aldehyde:ferredoxin oxidoreductase [Firmicutes bacterium]|nr:aldehyde:ferredoxin oxidoreductase [Bacillota bacterium]